MTGARFTNVIFLGEIIEQEQTFKYLRLYIATSSLGTLTSLKYVKRFLLALSSKHKKFLPKSVLSRIYVAKPIAT